MTANTSQLARLFQLMTSVADLAIRGSRDAEKVSAVLQRIKENPNFDQVPAGTVAKTGKGVRAFLRDWQTLYRQEFGIEINVSNIGVPKRVPGFDRLIVVAGGMTPEKIISVLKKRMTVWQYVDKLDTVKSDRTAAYNNYAIWVRDRVEADEELKNKSANDLAKEQINCITLEERLLFHLKYFLETGKHLDQQNFTLCAGSRSLGESVPFVLWSSSSRRLEVDWEYLDGADGNLRARAVVS